MLTGVNPGSLLYCHSRGDGADKSAGAVSSLEVLKAEPALELRGYRGGLNGDEVGCRCGSPIYAYISVGT